MIKRKFPKDLLEFINDSTWIFAVTMPEWPHEYIARRTVDNRMFSKLAEFIDKFGYEKPFYKGKKIYFECDGLTYWHNGPIINRCLNKDTYTQRKKDGTLPN